MAIGRARLPTRFQESGRQAAREAATVKDAPTRTGCAGAEERASGSVHRQGRRRGWFRSRTNAGPHGAIRDCARCGAPPPGIATCPRAMPGTPRYLVWLAVSATSLCDLPCDIGRSDQEPVRPTHSWIRRGRVWAQLPVRVRPLELTQQPVAAFDGRIKGCLRGFFAAERLLQFVV